MLPSDSKGNKKKQTACPDKEKSEKILRISKSGVSLQSHLRELGVWRSWLAHLVWDQRVLCSSHSTPTKERDEQFARLFFFGGVLECEALLVPFIHPPQLLWLGHIPKPLRPFLLFVFLTSLRADRNTRTGRSADANFSTARGAPSSLSHIASLLPQ